MISSITSPPTRPSKLARLTTALEAIVLSCIKKQVAETAVQKGNLFSLCCPTLIMLRFCWKQLCEVYGIGRDATILPFQNSLFETAQLRDFLLSQLKRFTNGPVLSFEWPSSSFESKKHRKKWNQLFLRIFKDTGNGSPKIS